MLLHKIRSSSLILAVDKEYHCRFSSCKMKLSYVMIGIYLMTIMLRSSDGTHEELLLLLLLLGLQVYIRQLGKGVVITIIDDSNGGSYTVQPTSTGSTTTTQAPVEPRLDCRAGYVLYPGPGTQFCYRYDNTCLNWNEARSACQMEGNNLAVLDNQSLLGFGDLMNRIFQAGPRICPPTNGIWIGAKTRVEDFVAEYIDGTTIPSNNPLWQDGPPFIENFCVQYNTDRIDQTRLRIDTLPCEFPTAYVCQQRR